MTKTITFFCGSLCEGGGERVISILANNFAKKGIPVEIILYYDRPIFYNLDSSIKITVIENETKTKKKIYNALWLRKYLKHNAKILISFFAPINMYAIMVTLFCQFPLIVADRNDPRKIPNKRITRVLRNFMYLFADGVVLQTNNNKDYFNLIVRKKSFVIFNPIQKDNTVGRALETIKKDEIVSVGRLKEQKNQIMLIRAFSQICELFPNYRLVIYGEGDYRLTLEKEVEKLGLKEKILLPGQVENIKDKICSAKLFVLPSNYEGMSNALMEAMVVGLPVITTNVSGAKELIVNGINGLIVEVGEIDQLRNSIVYMLENDDIRNHMAMEAIKIIDILDEESVINQWKNYIEKFIGEL